MPLQPAGDSREYEYLAEIGCGSEGNVVSAKRGQENVAIKVVRLTSQAIRKHVQAELQIGFGCLKEDAEDPRLKHMVEFKDWFPGQGGADREIHMVLERCEFQLDELLRTVQDCRASYERLRRQLGQRHNPYVHRVAEGEIVLVLLHMLRALSALNDRNVVHRDVKAENILWSNQRGENELNFDHGVYKLCDFGVAKRFAKTPLVSSEKVVVGTLWTIAPEVLRLENYSETCDVWSLGCVLWELMFLEKPFHSSELLSLQTGKVWKEELKPGAKLEGRQLKDIYNPHLSSVVDLMFLPASKRPTCKQLLAHPLVHELLQLHGYKGPLPEPEIPKAPVGPLSPLSRSNSSPTRLRSKRSSSAGDKADKGEKGSKGEKHEKGERRENAEKDKVDVGEKEKTDGALDPEKALSEKADRMDREKLEQVDKLKDKSDGTKDSTEKERGEKRKDKPDGIKDSKEREKADKPKSDGTKDSKDKEKDVLPALSPKSRKKGDERKPSMFRARPMPKAHRSLRVLIRDEEPLSPKTPVMSPVSPATQAKWQKLQVTCVQFYQALLSYRSHGELPVFRLIDDMEKQKPPEKERQGAWGRSAPAQAVLPAGSTLLDILPPKLAADLTGRNEATRWAEPLGRSEDGSTAASTPPRSSAESVESLPACPSRPLSRQAPTPDSKVVDWRVRRMERVATEPTILAPLELRSPHEGQSPHVQ